MNSFFRKPLFWICFSLVSALCFVYTYTFFSRAFPIVNLTITMDRDQALEQSRHLAQLFKWGPSDPSTAISFNSDSQAQTFIELEGGGQDAYLEMLKQHWYEPYTWHVRLLREFEPNETHVYFTPDGKLYGFKEQIAEDTDFPSLKKSEALALVQQALTQDWQIDMDVYALVEASKKVQQNERVDRTFVFERTDITLNDGRYRLKTVVSGNKLTEVKHFIKIPEAFTHTYRQMRSYNDAIASAGSIFAYIFYLLIGCLIGLFVLLKINWVIWQAPIKWALFIASLDFLMTLNSLPLWWMQYQTESSMYGFLLQLVVQALSYFFIRFTIMALVFTAAESLTRRAFGHHVRLWKSWSANIANSYTILGQTIGGYLMVGIDMAFLVTFYLLTTTYLSWWKPVSHLVDPNVLANYFPWFSSVAMSLGAGFLEECKFRAIPLAGAALLGERFGKKNWWIATAFILQAIVFSAAHANYPAQPAYARLVELIIPSFIFAGIYLRFGLLPSIISHYTYDVILFALPIFLAHAWFNQLVVLLCIFVPLWAVLYRRLQAGQWVTLLPDAYNRTWRPSTGTSCTIKTEPPISVTLSTKQTYACILAACIGLLAWVFCTPFTADSPPLQLQPQQATTIAKQTLDDHAISVDKAHAPYVQIKTNVKDNEKSALQHTYIWQTYHKPIYRSLIGTYVNPPHWLVRFLRFEGSLIERAQEYEVSVGADQFHAPTYQALTWKHKIPEQLPGATLTKKEARAIAQQALIHKGYSLDDIYEVKAKPKQLPERKDWTFTFANKKEVGTTKAGELRLVISIAGDQLNQFEKKVQVPEQFKREQLNNQTITKSVQAICQLLIWVLFIAGMFLALICWAKKAVPTSLFVGGFIGFALLFSLQLINSWPHIIAQFNTQAPFMNQLLNTYGLLIARYVIRATICAFVFSFVIAWRPRYRLSMPASSILVGIAAGLLFHGSWSIIELLKPSTQPLWGYYEALGTMLPTLGFALHYVTEFLLYTLGLSMCALGLNHITNTGQQKRGIAGMLAVVIALTMTGMQSLESLPYWMVSSALLGSIMFAIWYFFIRYAYAAIPIAIAISFSLSIAQQMIFNLMPHVWFSGILTIILLLAIALYWYIVCTRHQDVVN